MYSQYITDFYGLSQARLLDLGLSIIDKYNKGEENFDKEIKESIQLRLVRGALKSQVLTLRNKYDLIIYTIDQYELSKTLVIDIDFLQIDTIISNINNGEVLSNLIKHNLTLEKDGGNPTTGYYGHIDEEDRAILNGLKFISPVISFPNTIYTSGDDGAEIGTTFDYISNIVITPNNATIVSIKVFKTILGIENPVPIIDGVVTSFQITDSVTSVANYRLEFTYTNNSLQTIVVNTNRTVDFYYPTYYGTGAAGLDETGIKALVGTTIFKKIWRVANRTIVHTTNNNKIYFIELTGNTRRIVDVANNYTDSFTYTNIVYTFGINTPTMKVAEFNNILIPTTLTFNYYLS